VNVGIIGAGAIVRRGHLPAWTRIPGVRVAAIADIDLATARRVAAEFGIPRLTQNFRELLDDPNLEIIDIATPTPTHFEILAGAIESEKHVLVEKPLSSSYEQAREIARAAKGKRRKISVLFNYRYFPSVRRVKSLIDAGRLGQIVSLSGLALAKVPNSWTRSRWPYGPGGVLADFTPHLVDLMLWLNGSGPSRVFAMTGSFSRQMDFLTYAQMLVEFENGAVGSMDFSWLTGTSQLAVDLHGTGGHIRLDVKEDVFLEYHGTFTPLDSLRKTAGEWKSLARRILDRSFFHGPMGTFAPFFRDFLRAVKEDLPPPVTLEQAVAVDAVLAAAQTSLASGAAVNMAEFTAP